MSKKIVRIGGASGFWGESPAACADLLAAGGLDYLVFDYLAEISMSILARARAADPDRGYATDFVSAVIEPNLPEIARRGIRVISNAGGVNPTACGRAIEAAVERGGFDLKVAVVKGDDLLDRKDELARAGVSEMFAGEPLPDATRLASVNAYLGAFPIAAALDAGADIVVTGRVVDSAVTLGACIHEFGWTAGDLDRLAGGSLAGHILECSTQATGGNFTDWHLVVGELDRIGCPIAEVAADGGFVCTKSEGSGGLVSVGTVAEQMLYEIGDPQAYVLPDVVCDFSGVRVEQEGPDRVRVNGARGWQVPDTYKVSATYNDGFRGGQLLFFCGAEAGRKARAYGEAVLRRVGRRLEQDGLGDFSEVLVETFGDGAQYGHRCRDAREVTLKIAARHAERRAVEVLLREITGMSLAAPPGLAGFAGTRPRPSPVVRLFSFLWPKADVPVSIELAGASRAVEIAGGEPFDAGAIVRPKPPPAPDLSGPTVEVPLVRLALGRSGDKGNNANVGIIARKAEYLPYIWAALDERVVAECFGHFLDGPVERFLLPGLPAVNFVLHDALGGGGIASLRNDPQAKGYAQILLEHPIPVPRGLGEALR